MNVAQIYDLYLPDTMNWARKLNQSMPDADIRICTPVNLEKLKIGEKTGVWLVRLERMFPFYPAWLKRRFIRNPPDLIHAHFGPVACRYMSLAAELNIPLIATFHGYDFLKAVRHRPEYEKQYRRLFEQAAAVVCGGPAGVEILTSAGCPPEKIAVIPIGTQPEVFRFIPRTKRAGRLHLLQVGTMTGKKGYLDTLRAVHLARLNCPGLQLTISGERHESELVAEMRRFIAENRMGKTVRWLEPVPSGQMPAFLMGNFDVFIQPSCLAPDGDLEGGPITIMEAQSTGLPVISTKHMNIPTEVLHGETGLLAPEHDAEMLAKWIERFYHMKDPEYQLFSHAARTHIVRHFDIRQTGERYIALYKKIALSY